MKNLKKAILLFVMIAIFGNVKGQEYIHTKFYNVHYNSSTQSVQFSLKFKAGSNYVTDSNEFGKWGGLNIYVEFYLNGATITNLGSETVSGNFVGNQNDITNANMTGNVPLNQVLPATPTRAYNININRDVQGLNDLKTDSYSHIVTFSIPVSGQPAAGTYFHIRTFNYNGSAPQNGWTENYSNWSTSLWTAKLRRPFSSEKSQYFLDPSCPPQALWTGLSDSDWLDSDNWTNPVDFSPVGVPCATTDVFIPGTVSRFPVLTGNNRSTARIFCKDITFFQGGQVGRVDLLTYERARTQLNMYSPFYQSGYNTDFNNAFWNYSFHYSTPPLSNGQWHMLSMPLKGIVSGDLAYGGYPLTVMRKFNVMKSTSGRFTEGTWSTSFTETTEPFAAGEAFAFYVFGGSGFPREYFSNTEPDYTGYAPAGGFGLGITNGIIEFPTYDKADKLQSHRIQKYQGGVSTFYDIFTTGLDEWIGRIDYANTSNTKTRDSSTGNDSDYRFIGDLGNPVTAVSYPVPQTWSGSEEALIGNPFMSALDFDAFYAANGHLATYAMDYSAYRIWNGTEFVTYDCVTRTTSNGDPFTQYIAPMQGFFVTHMGFTLKLDFDAATMSKASPAPINLRSTAGEEQNIIRLSVRDHEYGTTTNAVIGQRLNATAGYKSNEDVTKLFSSTQAIEKNVNDLNFSYIPEIYTSAGDVALSMNYIGREGANVPIGVRVPAAGNSTLKLTGMNRYNADRIELLDNNGQFIADLTGKDSYEYSFSNGEGGYQSGRFVLRIAESTTGLDTIEESNLIQVYKSGNAIQVVSSLGNTIKQIRISDIQGRVLYSNTDVNADVYRVEEQFEGNQVLVVQVVTENNTESVKIKN